ncbi:unnamed protein product [Arctogadus glacialis]
MFSRSSKKRNSSRSGKPAYESQRGQPCNVCGDQCPGFSLHTWRSWKSSRGMESAGEAVSVSGPKCYLFSTALFPPEGLSDTLKRKVTSSVPTRRTRSRGKGDTLGEERCSDTSFVAGAWKELWSTWW